MVATILGVIGGVVAIAAVLIGGFILWITSIKHWD